MSRRSVKEYLKTERGLAFPKGRMMYDRSTSTLIFDIIHRSYPLETRISKRHVVERVLEMFAACHKHRHRMYPAGKTDYAFWRAVYHEVGWARPLGPVLLEEFALAVTEAARLGLKAGIQNRGPVAEAAVVFLHEIRQFKAHLIVDGESVRAYRARDVGPRGILGDYIKVVPAARGRLG